VRIIINYIIENANVICYIENTPHWWGVLNNKMQVMTMNNDKKKALQALKTSKGQIEGIIKMIEEGRYCVDISNQIIAAQALLKKANLLILRQHLTHCVKDAFSHGNGEEKIDEIMGILSKVMDK